MKRYETCYRPRILSKLYKMNFVFGGDYQINNNN